MQKVGVLLEKTIQGKTNTMELDSCCDKCGEKLYLQIMMLDKLMTVPRMCKCQREEDARIRIENENKQRQIRLDSLRKYSMMDKYFEECTFKNFKIDDRNRKHHKLALNYCQRWPEMKTKNMGLLFHGTTGAGKTYLAFCVANDLLEKLVPVIAVSSIAILNRIKKSYKSFGDEGEIEIINNLKNADMLVLDDLGTEMDTNWVGTTLYEILDSRYRDKKPMIVTTNLSLQQLKEKLTGNDLVTRTYDRLIEMCYPVKFEGNSRRVDAAKEKGLILEELLYENKNGIEFYTD